MKTNELKSFAKINLALHVTGKLKKLHKIESIVKFIELHDLISIKKINSDKHKVSFNGNFSKNIKKDNTVNKLFKILEKNKILNNQKFQVKIKKNIPQEAGLGGGSMNAATILNYLIKKNFIKIAQKKILQITNLIGSDVILGINPTTTILSSNGAVKRFLKTSSFYTLLVRPNFGCSTKEIYSRVKKITNSKFNNPKKLMFNAEYLSRQENALEGAAFFRYPKLKKIKSFLENLKNPLFVRMTGSGSVIIAYYQSKKDSEMAKVQFKRKYKNYWCNTSKTI
ncbi:4-diphosphocytidyl-2C-methyl-D-erythritol kinase [Candidatus Pelagibacter ubique]|uniref:4-(cytidine 5'-diphospho)-2-C-methyl-D-erythritol kinase n=1 Tax=Pelagibacter ubique TaxID=198252 RepID=UPI0003C7E465